MADLLYEKRNRIAYLTLNRPQVHNALNPEIIVRLAEAWQEIDRDDEVRAAIITGAGVHQASGRGIHHVRGNSADYDEIDLLKVDRMGLLKILDRFHGKIAGGNALIHQVAFANTGAVEYPLVGGVDHFLQILVGEDARRDVSADSSNFGSRTVCQ